MAGENDIAFNLILDASQAHQAARQTIDDFTAMGTASVNANQKASSSIDALASRLQAFGMGHEKITGDVIEGWKRSGEVISDTGYRLDASSRGLTDASSAARGLAQEMGITLPRATTRWLSQLEGIGPLLGAAFAPVAVVGMVEALGQLPREFDKLVGAVTGWDEKRQSAYEHFLADNKKAYDELVKFQAKMAEVAGGPQAGIAVSLADATASAGRDTRAAAALQNRVNARSSIEWLDPSKIGVNMLNLWSRDPRLQADADHYQQKAFDEANQARELQRKKQETGAEDAKKRNDVAKQWMAERQSYEAYFGQMSGSGGTAVSGVSGGGRPAEGQLLEYRNRNYANEYESRGLADDDVKTLNESTKRLTESLNKLTEFENEAGDARTKYEQYFKVTALEDYRNRTYGKDNGISGGAVATMEENSRDTAKQMTEGYKQLQRDEQKFIDSFRESAGRVWDDFFTRGHSVLSSLANLVKGLLNTIGRTLFQDFATTLLTGGSGSKGGVGVPTGIIGGALSATGLGRLFGFGGGASIGSSSGPWSENIPGIGSSSNLGKLMQGGGLLGMLTGGGTAAAAGIAVDAFPSGAGTAGILGPLYGFGTGGSTAAGGIGGALGLGGGAGLFGLGAATIPVIGGLAALGGFALWSIFHKHHNTPPTTADPLSGVGTRDVFFNSTAGLERTLQTLATAAAALSKSTGSMSQAVSTLSTQPPGQVMKDNFSAIKPEVTDHVAASMSNNRGFRLAVAGGVLQQAL